jgi:thymidylate synthase
MYQRSADMALGYPYNVTSYSLKNYLFCSIINEVRKLHGDIDNKVYPGKFYVTLGDAHIYEEHVDKLENMIKEKCNKMIYFPKVEIINKFKKNNKEQDLNPIPHVLAYINTLKVNDININNYYSHPFISMKMKE